MAELVYYRVCKTCDRTYEINENTREKGCPYCGRKKIKRVGRMEGYKFRRIVAGYEGKDAELFKYKWVPINVCYDCDKYYESNEETRKNGCPYCGCKRHKKTGISTKGKMDKRIKKYAKVATIPDVVLKQMFANYSAVKD